MHYRFDVQASVTERVWIEFHDRLRAFLLSRVHDQHAADDILQDVFLKVHKSIDSLRDDAKVAPWLYQIARNAIADHYRQRAHEPLQPDLDVEVREEARSAEQALAAGLRDTVQRLPERYREAVALTEIEGLSQSAMAERLGLSLSGAKSRVQRGREKLKEMLLDCCHIELDRCGGVIGFEERRGCCSRK